MIKRNENSTHGQNLIDFLESNSNLMKVALIGFEDILKYLYKDVEKLKGVPLKPDRKIALALLEYASWEDSRLKETVESLCGREIEKYFEWIDQYCNEYKCNREEALKRIIEEK